MKQKKILIIGLGNIGLNHLRAAKRFYPNVKLYGYDKKKISKNFLQKNNVNLLINLKKKLIFDLVIISTNSKERFNLFLELVKHNIVKNILFEKFVFFKTKQFQETLKILNKKKINAWVNCIRREIKIFKLIKKKLSKKNQLFYQSKDWGMGCNSIHFIDLFSFLLGSTKIKPIYINLEKKIYKSKRKGYMEFKGSMKFMIGNSTLTIQDDYSFNKKIFKIITEKKNFSFNKKENILVEKNINDKFTKKYICEEPKVSLVSYKVINKIINNKKIDLVSLKESFLLHKVLIDIFSKHLRNGNFKKKLKIT